MKHAEHEPVIQCIGQNNRNMVSAVSAKSGAHESGDSHTFFGASNSVLRYSFVGNKPHKMLASHKYLIQDLEVQSARGLLFMQLGPVFCWKS